MVRMKGIDWSGIVRFMSEWVRIYRNKGFWYKMGTGGVDVSYKSVYASVNGEMTKVRELHLGPFRMVVEGSACEFGRRVTEIVGNREIAEAIFGTNGASPDERGDMLSGMVEALNGGETVKKEPSVVVMSRNGNGKNGRGGRN